MNAKPLAKSGAGAVPMTIPDDYMCVEWVRAVCAKLGGKVVVVVVKH